ncbi:MAG: helix-turn-helix domain-containing protein [Clostridiales bacterium]|nr:helix-turn-helix domain-containing protein [Clostridiales bacterium]
MERRTLSVKELAQVMGIGENKARQLCKSKGFPCIKVGNRTLIPISRFEEWLNNSVGQEF